MSKYEMFDYDRLLKRIGIEPGETWFCGKNQGADFTISIDGQPVGQPGAHPVFCMSEDVNVNGLLLNHRDQNGTVWLCTDIQGWWTTPPAEIQDVPAAYWDGSALTTGRYMSRTVTISGCFIPPDPSWVWYNRDAIIRCASIVRGVGLLAMCGNQYEGLDLNSEMYDPPKMALIQQADVPLLDTTKGNGFTQFSLSFKAMQAVKLSVEEKVATVDLVDGDVVRRRLYKAFALTTPEGGGETTEYSELTEIQGAADVRSYDELLKVNTNALIESEQLTESTDETYLSNFYTASDADTVSTLVNRGNYFAHPIFVFWPTTDVRNDNKLKLTNTTTGETMRLRREVPTGKQLVVDTGMRRVALVSFGQDASEWVWDDRSYLTMTSEWISLAPGSNTLILETDPANNPPANVDPPSVLRTPEVHWRDTWIG